MLAERIRIAHNVDASTIIASHLLFSHLLILFPVHCFCGADPDFGPLELTHETLFFYQHRFEERNKRNDASRSIVESKCTVRNSRGFAITKISLKNNMHSSSMIMNLINDLIVQQTIISISRHRAGTVLRPHLPFICGLVTRIIKYELAAHLACAWKILLSLLSLRDIPSVQFEHARRAA